MKSNPEKNISSACKGCVHAKKGHCPFRKKYENLKPDKVKKLPTKLEKKNKCLTDELLE